MGMDIEKTIRRFAEIEREEAEKAKDNERNLICIDPDSYMAKEIKYQTALIHEILNEIRMMKNGI